MNSSIARPNVVRRALEEGCDLYEQGEFVKAAKRFHASAHLGNAVAQVNLGNMYDEGEGVTKSFSIARRWYKLAAKKGLPEGAWCLHVAYRNAGDTRMATFWLNRAARLGDTDALAMLASDA